MSGKNRKKPGWGKVRRQIEIRIGRWTRVQKKEKGCEIGKKRGGGELN